MKECTFEQGDEVGLDGLLESTDSRGLESEIGLEVLGNFPDEALERELADQELCGFLVTTDLTECDCTGAITMGLLDTSGSDVSTVAAETSTWGRIFWQPWRRVVCEGLCHQSTCGQFALCGPLMCVFGAGYVKDGKCVGGVCVCWR